MDLSVPSCNYQQPSEVGAGTPHQTSALDKLNAQYTIWRLATTFPTSRATSHSLTHHLLAKPPLLTDNPTLTSTVVLSPLMSAHVNTLASEHFLFPSTSHLAVELLVQQDVPCSNVSVDKGLTSQAHQAVHHLLTELEQKTWQVGIRP